MVVQLTFILRAYSAFIYISKEWRCNKDQLVLEILKLNK